MTLFDRTHTTSFSSNYGSILYRFETSDLEEYGCLELRDQASLEITETGTIR